MVFFYYFTRATAGSLCKLIFPTKKLGYREEEYDGPTVVICNHLSISDAVTLTTSFKKQSFFFVQKRIV